MDTGLFGAYTHSAARTNAALDYVPTVSLLGPQQSAPLPWDVTQPRCFLGLAALAAPQASSGVGTSCTPLTGIPASHMTR